MSNPTLEGCRLLQPLAAPRERVSFATMCTRRTRLRYSYCVALWTAAFTSVGCEHRESSVPATVDAGARDLDASERDASSRGTDAGARDLDASERDASPRGTDAATALPVLAVGTCGVLRQFALPEPIESIDRAPRGFVARQYDSDLGWFTWLAISEDGERETHFRKSNPLPSAIAVLPMGIDPFNGNAVIVYWGDLASSGMRSVWAESIDRASPHQLGEAFSRGTMAQARAISFDGRRAVHVTGHIATDVPHAFLIDTDGALVGAPVSLLEASHPASFDCLAAHATETAAALSVTDESLELTTWRLIELSSDGAVLHTSSLDATRFAGCPQVQRSRDGFVVGIRTPDGIIVVYKIKHLGDPELYARVTFSAQSNLLAIAELTDGSLVLVQRDAARSTQIHRIAADGSLTKPAGELPAIGEVVAAESGRVFALGPIDASNQPRTLYELGCAAQ